MLGLFQPKTVSTQVEAEQLKGALELLASIEGLEVNQNYLLEQTQWEVIDIIGLGQFAIINTASGYLSYLIHQSLAKSSILNVLNWFLAIEVTPKTDESVYLNNPVLTQQALYRQQLFDDWLKIHLCQ